MPYHNSVKHPLNFIYLSCLLDRGLIKIQPFFFKDQPNPSPNLWGVGAQPKRYFLSYIALY